jgi:hypothetical protein
MPQTVFDAILASLQAAADYHRDEVVQPAVILWTDEKREWERLVPRLRMVLPHFLVFGPYDKANRTGPAIWLRCVIAGKIADTCIPLGSVPIIYLPGVSRATLRATEECPQELKPLAELQYRGVFWSQTNGKDWTIAALLQTNHGGLQLKIAKDAATATSIRRCVEKLVDVPVDELRAKVASGELNSTYFDLLVSDDPVDDLLTWLSDPKGTRDRWEPNRWDTLCSRCIADYGFDPARDGEVVAAEKLGLQEKAAWKTAWKRFAATPARYLGLVELLRRAKPKPKAGDLFALQRVEFWPQDNEAREAELRQALTELDSLPPKQAGERIKELEKGHSERRQWVWAKLNRSPLAQAIEYLAALAEIARARLGGATAADMIRAYTEGGWQADAAVLDALAVVGSHEDRLAVEKAVAHVYAPWLRDAAELFQERLKKEPVPGPDVSRSAEVPEGTCILFADGLRYDVGQKLRALLESRVGPVEVKHQWAALPSVTPTAKPAVSPVAGKIAGASAGEEFRPSVAADGKDLTPDRFKRLLEEEGFQVLALAETGDPAGRAWTEYGNLDKTGHEEGVGLARRIPELLAGLVQRIAVLLAAGWQEVRVVTDHGWLLLPQGLPKCELPKYLTATRWRRCAVVKPSASVELSCFSWFWGDDVRIACPPGIDCFMAGEDYNHGGLSLQECIVPQLTIRRGAEPAVSAKIEQVKWARLRCRVKVSGQFAGCKVDLRDKAADPSTSLASAKAVGKDGSVALVVEDDKREGSATTLVLLDASGSVLDKTLVAVGG